MRIRECVLMFMAILYFSFVSEGVALTPSDMMQKALDRDDGKTEVGKVTLSSCRYMRRDNRLVCVESPRVKVMEAVRKDYGPRQKDKRLIMILRDPARERGIGFLQYDYDAVGKETDQWMYFSALGKVKRIVSGSETEPKDGSYFGSEFNYEDMETRHLENYTYKLLAEEVYRGRPCWVIESRPTPQWAKRSNYSKTLDWIDTERHLFMKTIFFNRQGKRIKRLTYSNPDRVNGIWVMRRRLMNNLVSRRISRFNIDAIVFNVPVADSFLTRRTLTDGAFRERTLGKYRINLE